MASRPHHALPRRADQGSTLVEFLLVFPAFLVLSMFVLETGLMWGDRHIARLAAFEAARVFAAANLPEFQTDGTAATNPCLAKKTISRAQQAALRKIAIVSPPLPLFLAKLGAAAHGLDTGVLPAGSISVDALRRLALRWPTAVASTTVDCAYDPQAGRVSVNLTYNRMLQTPFVDRVMYLIYQLSKLNRNGLIEVGLDNNFYGLNANLRAPGAIQELKRNLGAALDTVRQIHMPLAQATNFLKDVPGIGSLFASLPGIPADVTGGFSGEASGAAAALGGVSEVSNTIDQQSELLMSLVALVPEALRTIPIKTSVALQRESLSGNAQDTAEGPKERRWDGLMTGVMRLEGDYRKWGKQLSVGGGGLVDGAKPVDGL